MESTQKRTAIIAGVSVVAAALAVAAFLPYGQQRPIEAVASAATPSTSMVEPVQADPNVEATTVQATPVSSASLAETTPQVVAPATTMPESVQEDVIIAPAPEIEGVAIDTEDEGLGGDEMVIVDPSVNMAAAADIVSEPVYEEFVQPEPVPTDLPQNPPPVVEPEIEYINGVPKVDYEAALADIPEPYYYGDRLIYHHLTDCTYDPIAKTVTRSYETDPISGYNPETGEEWSIGTALLLQVVPSLIQ